MSIWHPASGLTYEQYLQANSFVRDVTGQVRLSGEALEDKVSKQTTALVASNEQLTKAFGRGFDSVNSTLEWGFGRLEGALQDVNASIDSLHADFNYSMGLLVQAAQVTNMVLSDIRRNLDAIHKTLQSPMLTQAREFYTIGCERLSKGLLDKALEALSEAEKRDDTDFFTQFHIGKLYLYGIDSDSNVVDLLKAKKHLLQASRYAKAEIVVDPTFSQFAAEALLHASIAVYAQLGNKDVLSDTLKTTSLLADAKRLAAEAVQLHPHFSESHYHSAKYSALLNEPAPAIEHLERAVTADRNYAVKVDIDRAFDSIRPHVLALLSRLREAKRAESQAKYEQVSRLAEEVKRWHPEDSPALATRFSKHFMDLATARQSIASQTYFGFLDAELLLDQLLSLLPQLKSDRIAELDSLVRQSLEATRDTLPSAGKYSRVVRDALAGAATLIGEAEALMRQGGYDAARAALLQADAAAAKATAACKLARQEDEQRSRNSESWEYAFLWGGAGAFFGAVVFGFFGCWSCVQNAPRLGTLMTPYNLLNGLLYGAVAGLVIGAVLGLLKGQMSD